MCRKSIVIIAQRSTKRKSVCIISHTLCLRHKISAKLRNALRWRCSLAKVALPTRCSRSFPHHTRKRSSPTSTQHVTSKEGSWFANASFRSLLPTVLRNQIPDELLLLAHASVTPKQKVTVGHCTLRSTLASGPTSSDAH
jgi:hypothetical protein